MSIFRLLKRILSTFFVKGRSSKRKNVAFYYYCCYSGQNDKSDEME